VLASHPRGYRSIRHAGGGSPPPLPFRVARSASIDDVAGITVLSLSARIKDPLRDRRSALVGRLPNRAACMNGRFRTWHTAVIPCAALLAYVGHRAFGLLHGRLLDELCA
jgi:hypothetical protein